MQVRTIGFFLAILVTALAGAGRGKEERMKRDPGKDRQEILNHVRSIFEAYIRKDRETIQRTHAADWAGFLGPSTRIERGIEDYMREAERSLENFDGIGYRLLDTEFRVYEDTGIIYYTARYDYRDGDGNRHSLPLRSIDIYRRENGEWIQAGSHIGPIPAGGSWGEKEGAGPSRLTTGERESLLAAREAVWRAWFTNDQEHLRQALPDELIAIDPGVEDWSDQEGTLLHSSEFSTGGSRLVRLDFPRTEILAYDNVAILFSLYRFEIEKDGRRSTTSGRGTEIFVRRDGRWVNSGWHLDSGR